MSERLRNWAGNIQYSTEHVHYPETVTQVQEIVSRSRRARVVGTRHSFNRIADTDGDLISLAHLEREVTLDHATRTVTVDGGARYGDICEVLHKEGYALRNLASLPHISVAGAVATATHGSGDRNGNLATAVAAMEVVTADGEKVTLSRGDPDFAGAVVALGALGVITRLTLDVVPAFEVRQDVYEKLPLDRLEAHFETILSAGYSVSLFTDWRESEIKQVWLKRRVIEGEAVPVERVWFGARLASRPRHPIDGLSAENCTEQMGVPGPWHSRLPHFRMAFTPSSGDELQSEYLFPRDRASIALREIQRLGDRIAPLLQVSEIRSIAADDLWMSPCYRQPCVGVHFTWQKDWPAVRELLPVLESRLAPLSARPHWGKLFAMPPERVQGLYAKLPEFQALLRRYDPQGKFRNPFVERYIFGAV